MDIMKILSGLNSKRDVVSNPLLALALLLLPALLHADDTALFQYQPADDAPARIMLVVDTSGSMAWLEGDNSLDPSYDGDCAHVEIIEHGVTLSDKYNSDRKICIVKSVLMEFLDSTVGTVDSVWPDNFEVGLAKYGEPGAVIVQPLRRLDLIDESTSKTHREILIESITALTVSGNTPLVGSYLEVAEYLTGGSAFSVASSDSSNIDVWESALDKTEYKKDVQLGAQCIEPNNHIIFLTDGASTCEKGAGLTAAELALATNCSDQSSNIIPSGGSTTLGMRANELVTGLAESRLDEDANAVRGQYGASCPANFSSYWEMVSGHTTYWNCLSSMSDALLSLHKFEDGVRVDEAITTHVIAYDLDGASQATKDGMAAWATGKYVAAASHTELYEALQTINTDEVLPKGTFVVASGGVGVSQLNRFSHLDELYFSVFTPTGKPFWYGNLKQYFFQIDRDGDLDIYADQAKTTKAVEDGKFLPDVTSIWSDDLAHANNGEALSDGNNAEIGGAASQIKQPGNRKLFVNFADEDYELSTAVLTGDEISGLHSALLAEYRALLPDPAAADADATVAAYDAETLSPSLLWLLGVDVNEEWIRVSETLDPGRTPDNPLGIRGSDYANLRNFYGAPLHSSPMLVNYKSRDSEGLPLDDPENVVFVSTNDGKLYAVDSENGEEKLAFLPEAMLKRTALAEPSPIERMYNATKPNAADGNLLYGLDSTWTVWRQDVDGNGNIDEDTLDFVYLYGGMRRGGRNYYILDATDVEASRSIEQLAVLEGGTGKFENIGQTWSEPRLAIIKYLGVNTAVFIVGGGYDTVYDDRRPTASELPAKGAQIYIIRARKLDDEHPAGEVLWWASSESVGDDATHVEIDALQYSIPSSVKTVDRNGDGFLNFFYVGDMGGQVHRFDINNGNTTAAELVSNPTGTVIAQLGIAGAGVETAADDRRFFYPPSVAEMRCPAGLCMGIAIGSGWRSNPTDVSVKEQFYFLRDYEATNLSSNLDLPVITESALTAGGINVLQEITKTDDSETPIDDASSDSGVLGFRLELGDTGYNAEKLMGSPLIVGGMVYFSTYYRPAEVSLDTCQVGEGASAIYRFIPGDAQALTLADGLSQNVAGSIQALISEIPETMVDTTGDGEPDTVIPAGLQGGIVSGTGSVGPAPLSLDHIRKTRWSQVE